MRQKIFKKLAEGSKTGGKLDSQKIEKIAMMLSRKDLKKYLFLLRRTRLSEKVVVETPSMMGRATIAKLKKRFKGKDIIIHEDLNLIGGMRITVKDFVFDSTIKNALEKAKEIYE